MNRTIRGNTMKKVNLQNILKFQRKDITFSQKLEKALTFKLSEIMTAFRNVFEIYYNDTNSYNDKLIKESAKDSQWKGSHGEVKEAIFDFFLPMFKSDLQKITSERKTPYFARREIKQFIDEFEAIGHILINFKQLAKPIYQLRLKRRLCISTLDDVAGLLKADDLRIDLSKQDTLSDENLLNTLKNLRIKLVKGYYRPYVKFYKKHGVGTYNFKGKKVDIHKNYMKHVQAQGKKSIALLKEFIKDLKKMKKNKGYKYINQQDILNEIDKDFTLANIMEDLSPLLSVGKKEEKKAPQALNKKRQEIFDLYKQVNILQENLIADYFLHYATAHEMRTGFGKHHHAAWDCAQAYKNRSCIFSTIFEDFKLMQKKNLLKGKPSSAATIPFYKFHSIDKLKNVKEKFGHQLRELYIRSIEEKYFKGLSTDDLLFMFAVPVEKLFLWGGKAVIGGGKKLATAAGRSSIGIASKNLIIKNTSGIFNQTTDIFLKSFAKYASKAPKNLKPHTLTKRQLLNSIDDAWAQYLATGNKSLLTSMTKLQAQYEKQFIKNAATNSAKNTVVKTSELSKKQLLKKIDNVWASFMATGDKSLLFNMAKMQRQYAEKSLVKTAQTAQTAKQKAAKQLEGLWKSYNETGNPLLMERIKYFYAQNSHLLVTTTKAPKPAFLTTAIAANINNYTHGSMTATQESIAEDDRKRAYFETASESIRKKMVSSMRNQHQTEAAHITYQLLKDWNDKWYTLFSKYRLMIEKQKEYFSEIEKLERKLNKAPEQLASK